MADLSTIIYLLMGLLGFFQLQEDDKLLLSDPAIAKELGIENQCFDCDKDALKKQFLIYQDDKEGGIIIDELAAD